VMFCNQNFADYPVSFPEGKFDPSQLEPQWMLLSYKKKVRASSSQKRHGAELAVNEDVRTWWSAATNKAGEYIELDLGESYAVHAIQVNLADGNLKVSKHRKEEIVGHPLMKRFIETNKMQSRYTLEGSRDGREWFVLEDKRNAETDLAHDFFIYPDGKQLRYIKVTGYEFPYGQSFKVSGLRVFGKGSGSKPAQTEVTARRTGDLNALIRWDKVENAQGYNIRYGVQPDKLYLSWLVYDKTELDLSTLNKGSKYFVCVDSFNENGITQGKTIEVGNPL
jgi:F5/8 type C domain-containing protein